MSISHDPPIKNGRFFNPHIEEIRRNFKDVILWQMGFYADRTKTPHAPEGYTYPIIPPTYNAGAPTAIWINHSTYLISVNGLNFLTDPIWSDRCSPISFFGPKRRHPPAIALNKLPKIDYVLISHDHYDHLDKASVMKLFELFPQIIWLVPLGVKNWFHRQGISNVFELSWWQEMNLNERIKVTAVPAQHFSGRRASKMNDTLWAGWVVSLPVDQKCFYFVGDTGYNPYDFKQIGAHFKKIDLSLIPIGSYVPRRFMSPVHIEPRDAVRIHKEVHSLLSLGMHWKTFRLSDEPMHQPPFDLLLAMQEEGMDPKTFLPVDPGVAINW